jgi:glycosyltransferase involved in cell wall biosynthesis
MANKTPFFSVIITTFNRDHLICRALKSLTDQSDNNWEAIIVDDGSTDHTFTVISEFTDRFPGFRYIKQSHSGMAAARNTGIAASEGRFITFLDSDDEFHPLHLETRRSIIEENPHIEFLYGKVKIIGNQFVPDRFDSRKTINLNNCIIGGTFFIQCGTLNLLKGFRDIALGSDADLFERAKCAGIRMMEVFLPTYIYHHETMDSITNQLLIRSD